MEKPKGVSVSNPRKEAFAALREAEAQATAIPDALTIGAIEKVRQCCEAQAVAVRRALEWMDAIETP